MAGPVSTTRPAYITAPLAAAPPHPAHVVGDEHHRRSALAAHAFEQIDDLSLHRHVEGGGGFVGDDDARLAAERQRQDDALAHAAGQFVRIAVEPLARSRNTNFRQQSRRALAGLVARYIKMRGDGLDQLVADRHQRIETGERVLENGSDLPSAQPAHLLLVEVVDAPSFEQYPAAGLAGWQFHQAE